MRNNRKLYESIMKDVSKTIKKHIKEAYDYNNARLMSIYDGDDEFQQIKQLLIKLKKIGGIENFKNIVFVGDNMDPKLTIILEKYDDFMETIMWQAIEQQKGILYTAKLIKQEAYRNYNGTDFVINFLEDLLYYLY